MLRNLNRIDALELRKQLLIAESDLNRLQLSAAKSGMTSGLHTIAHGVTSVGALASSAAMLATSLAAGKRRQHRASTQSLSLQTVLHGTALIASVWLALIPRKT